MISSKRGSVVAMAWIAGLSVASSQVEPLPGGGSGGVPKHGVPENPVWTTHQEACVKISACPTQTKPHPSLAFADPCSYCALGLDQKSCSGEPVRECTQTEYRGAAAPPSCGQFFFGGVVGLNGVCQGAVGSSTQVCYRVTCSNAAPSEPSQP